MKKAIGIDISKYDRTFNPELSIYPLDFVVARAGVLQKFLLRWRTAI